jgi:hypothetical protein
MVSSLMKTLDARSRFEAGARAVLHGWPRRMTAAGHHPSQKRLHKEYQETGVCDVKSI